MNPTRLENLLKAVAAGSTTAQDAIDELKSLPFQEMNIAKPDLHRSLRQGASEAIFCQGKTADQVVAIARELLAAEQSVLATRCDTAHREALERHFVNMKYNELGRVASIGARALFEAGPLDDLVVLVITAGTADLPVAEESAAVLEHFGFSVKRVYDVGVAGLHRLLAQVKT